MGFKTATSCLFFWRWTRSSLATWFDIKQKHSSFFANNASYCRLVAEIPTMSNQKEKKTTEKQWNKQANEGERDKDREQETV